MAMSNVSSLPRERAPIAAAAHCERDPYERIVSRLNALKAVRVLAGCVLEGELQPAKDVWIDLWHGASLAAEDINRDLDELNAEIAELRAVKA